MFLVSRCQWVLAAPSGDEAASEAIREGGGVFASCRCHCVMLPLPEFLSRAVAAPVRPSARFPPPLYTAPRPHHLTPFIERFEIHF